MEAVEDVLQLDETRLHWKPTIAGKPEEWDAGITDQVPDQRIAWRGTSGAKNSGIITFAPAGPDTTRVTATISCHPEGIVETAGDALGVVDARVKGDLERFKEFIEGRGAATGAWRGEGHGDETGAQAPK
jgi:uncharacterized membrane protein